MTTFGVGIGNFFGGSLIKLSGAEVPSIALSGTSYYFHRPLFADGMGWFGDIFLSYGFMVYLAIAISLLVAYVMRRTRTGLHLRAVGENPSAIHSVTSGLHCAAYTVPSPSMTGALRRLQEATAPCTNIKEALCRSRGLLLLRLEINPYVSGSNYCMASHSS